MLSRFKVRSEFSRNVLILMFGIAVAQAIPIAITPVLTRIYSPEDFGLFSLYMSIVSIISVVSTGRFDLAIILPKHEEHALQIVYLSTLILILVFFASIFGGVTIVAFFELNLIYYTIPLMVLCVGVNGIFDRFNNRIKNYKFMSLQRFFNTSLEAVVSILLGAIFGLKIGLVIGRITGYTFSTLLMLHLNWKTLLSSKLNFSKMIVLATRYISFPKYNTLHALLNTVSANFPVIIIPFFYGKHVLGLYALGLKIVQAPLGLISASMFSVLSQKMAVSFANGQDIGKMALAVFRKLALIVLLLIPFLIFADEIFALIFNEKWREAGIFVQIFSPAILSVFITSPFASIPQIFNKQRQALFLESACAFGKMFVLIFGGYFFDIKFVLFFLALVTVGFTTYTLVWYRRLINFSSKK